MTRSRVAVCPPDHALDETSTCYLGHGCACAPCLEARCEYQFWRRGMLAAGRTDVFDRIVDGRGVRRRLQALMALGYSARRIGHRLEVTDDQVLQWMRTEKVRQSTHARIDALYEQLSTRRPSTETRGDRISVNRAQRQAQLHGYVLPLGWDDIDLDDAPPAAEPTGEVDVVAIDLAVSGHRVKLTTAERHEVVRQLNARLYFDTEIAALVGVSSKTIARDRDELGIPGVSEEQRAAATARPDLTALAA